MRIRTPSIKALQDGLNLDEATAREAKRLLTASRQALEETPEGAARVAECYHAPGIIDLRLTCLDAVIGTHGVESFDARGRTYWYLNAGDTYASTIVRTPNSYRVACWGDFAE